MSRVRAVVAVAGILCGLAALAACGDAKAPMVPDNPTADPLMMDAGGPTPADTPATASSAK
jgi:hypothetical protein